jgi:hydrogenase maturation protease
METIDVEKIAEAVLYEGYLLFPYRRSALKNQQRWTLGGVYPRAYSEANGGSDPWLMQTQCLVAGDDETEIEIKLRFLHVVERSVIEIIDGTPRPVAELRVGTQVYRPWEEAMEREHIFAPLRLRELLTSPYRIEIDIPAGSQSESLHSPDGTEAGALVRKWQELKGEVEIRAEEESVERLALSVKERSEEGVRRWALGVGEERANESGAVNRTQADEASLHRVTVRIVNTTPWPNATGETQETVTPEGAIPPYPMPDTRYLTPAPHPLTLNAQRSTFSASVFVSMHTILRARGGEFVSLLEPPDRYREAVEACDNIKTWPVLVGEAGERHTILSSPIILYDYPQISPESQGNFFDATEIDELLTLTVLTLTDEEKQEMRESDIHGREILERTEALSEEQIMKLHSAVRALQPAVRKGEA